jgi:2'-5' RNA ligase
MVNNTENKGAKAARMYFIALVLPGHLDEKVLAHKQWMQERFGSKVGLKSPAHITIVPPYWMDEEKEASLRQDMTNLARTVSSFALETAGFSAFKPRTIFVAVQESAALNELKKKADDFFRRTDYKMKFDNRPFHPHITIATRDLQKKDFGEAWLQIQNKEFKYGFEAEGLSLLKHNGRNWDVAFTASFQSLPSDLAGQP